MIVRLKGGLGNQMFQYAYAKALSAKHGGNVKIDIYAYEHQAARDTKRAYQLDIFDITLPLATRDEVKKYHTVLYKYLSKIKGSGFYHEGWWQSEKYFKSTEESIREDFILKHPFSADALRIEQDIHSSRPAVSLHIRRGDYMTNQYARAHHGLTNFDYYKKSMEILRDKIGNYTIFVFSDDMSWVKDHLLQIVPQGIKVKYVSNPLLIADYEEMVLMSHCDHHIIANSSFSWWGAWLNPNPHKIVIAPKQWLADPTFDVKDIVPKEWIRV